MRQNTISAIFAVMLTAVLASSCSSQPGPAGPEIAPVEGARTPGDRSPLDYILTDVEVFDLGIAEDFFQRDGRSLSQFPHIDSCHMQGAVIADGFLVISCILFNDHERTSRTYVGKSFVLRAWLCDIIGCPGAREPRWQVEDITEAIPPEHSLRISKNLFGTDELSGDQRAITHLMTHPSGLLHGPEPGTFWVGNAVYDRDTYSRITLLSAADIGTGEALSRARRTIDVPRGHTSAIAVIKQRYMISPLWGSRTFLVLDMQGDGQQLTIPNPWVDTADHVQLQDCTEWQNTYMICNGNWEYVVDPANPDVPLHGEQATALGLEAVRVRHGRIQVLQFDVSDFPRNVSVELIGYIQGVLPGREKPGINFGDRKYQYDEDGQKKTLIYNDYRGFVTPTTITHEAMAVDPEREYLYFVPADIPGGKLIRMRLGLPGA